MTFKERYKKNLRYWDYPFRANLNSLTQDYLRSAFLILIICNEGFKVNLVKN